MTTSIKTHYMKVDCHEVGGHTQYQVTFSSKKTANKEKGRAITTLTTIQCILNAKIVQHSKICTPVDLKARADQITTHVEKRHPFLNFIAKVLGTMRIKKCCCLGVQYLMQLKALNKEISQMQIPEDAIGVGEKLEGRQPGPKPQEVSMQKASDSSKRTPTEPTTTNSAESGFQPPTTATTATTTLGSLEETASPTPEKTNEREILNQRSQIHLDGVL